MKLNKNISQVIVSTLLLTSLGGLGLSNVSRANEIKPEQVKTNLEYNLKGAARCEQLREQDYIVKSKNYLNLRKTPSKNGTLLVKIPSGSVITKISALKNNWAKTVYVTPQGVEYIGYAYYGPNYTSVANFKKHEFGMITSNNVNFRKGGSATSTKLGSFKKGDTVEVLSKANSKGFYKVRVYKISDKKVKLNIGYVHKKYFKKEVY